MKILFYLPAVTPWWFENIIEPLIRRIVDIAEVHVLAPPMWRNTGIGPDQLALCADLPQLQWAIADGGDHPTLRTAPADPAGLIDYVRGLSPDIVLCRSADFETPRHFPGVVRHIMEAVTSPFDVASAAATVYFTDAPYANGVMPPLDAAATARIDAAIAPLWEDMKAFWAAQPFERGHLFDHLGIPGDRPIIMLPLEYAHEENFFPQHRPGQRDNAALIAHAARHVTPRCTLVITDHPLNALHLDEKDLLATIAGLGSRVVYAGSSVYGQSATMALLPFTDGVLLNDSKTFASVAALGRPMLRDTRFASGEWLNAETDIARFVEAVRTCRAAGPDAEGARRWFGYHFANEAFCAGDPALTGAMVIDRACNAINMDRWDAGIARVRPRLTLEQAA
ncbi:hypothetical protein ACX40Y_03455 [Sphingomonas sp. RS6]